MSKMTAREKARMHAVMSILVIWFGVWYGNIQVFNDDGTPETYEQMIRRCYV